MRWRNQQLLATRLAGLLHRLTEGEIAGNSARYGDELLACLVCGFHRLVNEDVDDRLLERGAQVGDGILRCLPCIRT